MLTIWPSHFSGNHPTDLVYSSFRMNLEERILNSHVVNRLREPRALPLVYFPDDRLNQVCLPVVTTTERTRQIATDMIFTMMVHHGIGLAGPQVGVPYRIFVVDIKWERDLKQAEPHVFINPVVTPVNMAMGEGDLDQKDFQQSESKEGCLSFPNAHVRRPRYTAVHVKATGMDGEVIDTVFHGLMARVVQHENDHLDGITINKHLTPMQRSMLRKGLKTVSHALR